MQFKKHIVRMNVRIPGVKVRKKGEEPPTDAMLGQVRDRITRKSLFARVLFGFVSLTVGRFLILIYLVFNVMAALRAIPGEEITGAINLQSKLATIDRLSILAGFFGLSIMILLFLWIFFAVRKRNEINHERVRFTPTLAILSFLIPVLNTILPVLVIIDLWSGSTRVDPDKPRRMIIHGIVFAVIWWLFFLLEIGLNIRIATLRLGAGIASGDLALVVGLVGLAAMVALIHGICLLLLVAGIEKQQQDTAASYK